MVGFLYNNGRMNDLRDMLRAEIAKNQSELLMKFAELENRLDTRLSRIESHMNLGWPRRHASTAPLQPSRTLTRTASARAQALPPT